MKSRSTWLKAGDRNTSFFHKQCGARISLNHISKITSLSRVTIKGFSQIKQAAEVHFQNMYKEDGFIDSDLASEFLTNIPWLVRDEENEELMKPFLKKDIIDVIWSMGSDKAPGPYGFSFHFYRVCWSIIRKDFLRMIKDFQLKAKVGVCTNSTFLALIPKEVNPSSFD